MNAYISVDLETTGLAPKKDRILEIGALKMADGEVADTFHCLVDPAIDIPERITLLTGITQEMVRGEKRIVEVIADFADWAGDLPFLGHNLMFDYAFLKHAAVNRKIQFEKNGVDTLKICRLVHPELQSRALGAMCAYYGIEQRQAHRADDDAFVTAALYEKLKQRFEDDQPELFAAKPLQYKAKKQSPVTDAQKRYLNDLIKYHTIKCNVQIDSLTKSEASRMIDGIILQYGRILKR